MYRSYDQQPTKRELLYTSPHGAEAWHKEEVEAQDTGVVGGVESDEDDQPPHT